MSDLFGRLKSSANKVAFEADKMTRLNRAQTDVRNIKTQIDGLYTSLGELYYRRYRTETSGDAEFAEIVKKIQGLEEDMAVRAETVAHINAETYNPESKPSSSTSTAAPTSTTVVPAIEYSAQESTPPEPVNAPPQPIETPSAALDASTPAPQPDSKVCPNCGFIVPAATRFCPECGNKMEG